MSNRLTFINLSSSGGVNLGKDEDTKSRVRSQVMKNLRRKQRLEDKLKFEEAQAASGSTSLSRKSSPSASEDKGWAQASLFHEHLGPGGQAVSASSSRVIDAPLTVTHARRPLSSESPIMRQYQLTDRASRSRDRSSYQQQCSTRAMISNLPASLHGWQAGGETTSSTEPEQFHKLLYTVESYVRFLSEPLILTFPVDYKGPGGTSKLKACFEENASNELVLFTTHLVHLGHTTAIKFLEENVPICVSAKAKALNHLQQSLRETVLDPDPSLIGAVLLVLSFEMIRGSNAIPVHYAGLLRLLDLQSKSVEVSWHAAAHALLPALIACDLILAATSPDRTPGIVKLELPLLYPLSAEAGAGFYRSSPLMLVESFDHLRCLYRGVPSAFVDVLSQAFQSTQTHLSAPGIRQSAKHTQREDGLSRSATVTDTVPYHPRPSACSGVLFPTSVHQAVLLAATIHFRATRLGIPFESPTNQGDARQLGQLLNENPLSAWRGIPYIYLWILLTGAAAAQFHPERQYMMAELVRFGFSVALEHVDDFKRELTAMTDAHGIFLFSKWLTHGISPEILTNFIWLRQGLPSV
ncbi:hypothetical protein A1O1_00934 [Capronia coronata CBS 617.96]|uniref:Transcription factor domain-containing protein n=1 Tax=Capronia coronata CBS 617.96 TaxID=1182541 RepID=W9Z1G9_9EURO|nr:uncharacterized protein A1O1_00934 [Capronia coronata CBS 617.96]EXJ95810.1 hypothetical protein A1O1_00934 [Capronia coronata CBS 617.96]